MNDVWVIVKNTERYDNIAPYWPNRIVCYGTKEQAEHLAAHLTNYQAGCDYAFYVKHACHCCGFLTMHEDPTDTFNICPVCFWEHEYEEGMPFGVSGPNGVSLEEAKANFKRIGACTESNLPLVRGPLPEEVPR